MTVTLTDEQQAIRTYVRDGRGHLIIEAGAGTGKTFTLLEALKVIPQRSILLAAFNKAIADELKVKLPKLPRTHGAHVKTFHALGNAIVGRHFPKLKVDKDATEELITRASGMARMNYNVRRAAVRLLRIAKETLVGEPSEDEMLNLGWEYDVFSVGKLNDRDVATAIMAAINGWILGLQVDKREAMDFYDMIWLPVALKLEPPSRYQAIVIDELQDIAPSQFELLRMVALPLTRWIAAGDINQQIYQWRGSMGRTAWDAIGEHTQLGSATKHLPLTMTWRCSKTVVKLANQLVPTLRAHPNAEDGEIGRVTLGELPLSIGQGFSETIHTFVLSRTNADLVDAGLFLWREGIKFQLNAGANLLEPLFYLLDHKLDLRNEEAFSASLTKWAAIEHAKAEAAQATAWIERVEEQTRMLRSALKYAAPTGIKRLLNGILAPGKTGVLLSTVHKVKGLEAERVFLLEQTFARHRELGRVFTADGEEFFGPTTPTEEELNIEYVAITRAKTHLIWVDIRERDTAPEQLSPDELRVLTVDEMGELQAKLDRHLERLLEKGEEPDDQLKAYTQIVRQATHRVVVRAENAILEPQK